MDKYGPVGFKIAMEYVKAIELFVHINPWLAFRQRNWKDATDLKALFESESLSDPNRRPLRRSPEHAASRCCRRPAD